MTGAEWIAEKINSAEDIQNISAAVENDHVVFISRGDKPNAYVGVVPTRRGSSAPIVELDDVRGVYAQNNDVGMIIAIPRGARWAGSALSWLQSKGIAFGGVGDLFGAIYHDEDISTHRNKAFTFVDEGLRQHSRVSNIEWIDSKKARVRLCNDVIITVGLEDAYDITMDVAREAARNLGRFDVLLKLNPNGSITSNGAENAERLGFETLKWGELFAYLAKRSRSSGKKYIKKRL